MNTTFRRQLLSIIALMLAATLLIGMTFWVLLSRFLRQRYENKLNSAAMSVCDLISAYSTHYLDDWDFRVSLSVASNASECNILIADAGGKVLLCAEKIQGCEFIGEQLINVQKDNFFELYSEASDDAAAEIYHDSRLAVAVPVVSQSGERLCIVLASMSADLLDAVSVQTVRIFALTALAVLILFLFIVPMALHRESKPLRTMAAAARQIAHGNFDVHVSTEKQSEEMRQLAIAFNNMAAELKRSEEAQKDFVANVSHELKTPMTTIAGYIDGMIDGTIPKERHEDYMQLVSTQVRRLSRLVRSMLDVARLRDTGVRPEQMQEFNVCDLAGQSLIYFEQRIEKKNIDVRVDMPENGVMVRALADSITQVLQNLIDNAVKFVNPGGTLSLKVIRRGTSAVITVGNTGETLPREELPLIFERFHKTDRSRSMDRDGVGLGLYIVKTIILSHGEDIYVTSHDGVTEFSFTLSLAK